MQIAHELAKQNIAKTIEKRVNKFNLKAKDRNFKLGDKVYMNIPQIGKGIARKLAIKWRGPMRIEKQIGKVTFVVKEINGHKTHIVHANRLTLVSRKSESSEVANDFIEEEVTALDKDLPIEPKNKQQRVLENLKIKQHSMTNG